VAVVAAAAAAGCQFELSVDSHQFTVQYKGKLMLLLLQRPFKTASTKSDCDGGFEGRMCRIFGKFFKFVTFAVHVVSAMAAKSATTKGVFRHKRWKN